MLISTMSCVRWCSVHIILAFQHEDITQIGGVAWREFLAFGKRFVRVEHLRGYFEGCFAILVVDMVDGFL